MRMRRKRNLDERIEACGSYITLSNLENKNMKTSVLEKEYIDLKGLFGNDNPVHIEIGSGKGYFACELAKRNPDINVLAIEMISNVAIVGAEIAKEEDIQNVRFFVSRAECLPKYFPDHSIGVLYLNFSTPLPKDGYAKQRLTHERFLKIYQQILKEDGVIYQKTDNVPFFEFSQEQFKKCGFRLENVDYDYDAPDNIKTEHEEMFKKQGISICRLEAHLGGNQ